MLKHSALCAKLRIPCVKNSYLRLKPGQRYQKIPDHNHSRVAYFLNLFTSIPCSSDNSY